jgi:hypothetical protein
MEDGMNMSWLSMIGGGITAAATLAVGISTSGILAANPTGEVPTPTAGETIYVEQPVIEVSASGLPYATTSIDPIVIAVLPASPATGTTPASTPVVTDPSVTPDPSMSAPPYEEGEEYVEDEEGEYDEEYEGPEEGEYEDEEEGEYEGPEEVEDEDD